MQEQTNKFDPENCYVVVWLKTGGTIVLKKVAREEEKSSVGSVSLFTAYRTTDVEDFISGGTDQQVFIPHGEIVLEEPITNERYAYLREISHRNHQIRDIESQLRLNHMIGEFNKLRQQAMLANNLHAQNGPMADSNDHEEKRDMLSLMAMRTQIAEKEAAARAAEKMHATTPKPATPKPAEKEVKMNDKGEIDGVLIDLSAMGLNRDQQ